MFLRARSAPLRLVAFLVSALAVPTARAADRDCADFENQQEAQDYFLERGGPSSDPDLLDGDGDGVACDSLPCPCSAGPSEQLRPAERAQTIRARVTEVIDGDTIRVKSLEATGRSRYTVRLIGIDTPEVYGGIECGGRQASAHMKRIARRPSGAAAYRSDPGHLRPLRPAARLREAARRAGRGDLPAAGGPGEGLCLWRKSFPAGAIVPAGPAVGTRGRAGCVGHVRRQLPSRARGRSRAPRPARRLRVRARGTFDSHVMSKVPLAAPRAARGLFTRRALPSGIVVGIERGLACHSIEFGAQRAFAQELTYDVR